MCKINDKYFLVGNNKFRKPAVNVQLKMGLNLGGIMGAFAGQ
jgi:hypothetical protein